MPAPFNIPTPSIGEVFRNSHPFYVPKYQRGYAWEDEEIGDFIADIQSIAADSLPTRTHFLGGMVNVHVPAPNSVSRKHEVVDGQQRMATVSLTIACIIRSLESVKSTARDASTQNRCSAHIDELSDTFLRYKEIQGDGRVDLPKLLLSNADEPFFRELVSGSSPSPSRASHERLQRAYNEIMRKLVQPSLTKGAAKAKLIDVLVALSKVVSDRLLVMHIVSQTCGEAYRLFSVLNDRGRSLTDGDLLRARTLELLEVDRAAQQQAEPLWDKILDGSPEGISKFLKAYYPSLTATRAPGNNLYDAYEKQFLRVPKNSAISAFVSELAAEKPIFTAIEEGQWPYLRDSKATAWDRDRLRRLVKVLRHEVAHPLLLSAVKLGEKKFIEVVRLLELFVFRYITIVGAHPSPLYKPYYAQAKEMRESPSTYSVSKLRSELATLAGDRAPDETFKLNLIAKLTYSDNTVRNREIRHFLSTLESYSQWFSAAGKKKYPPKPDVMTVYDIDTTTLEHIYPQNVQASSKDVAMEQRKEHLANLTIMDPDLNSEIGNGAFAEKKHVFAKSKISLTKRLGSFPTWTQVEFGVREEELIAMALAVFRI